MALELPAGRLKETATEVGDLLEFQPFRLGHRSERPISGRVPCRWKRVFATQTS
jgi:hypothetical protein